MVSKVVGIEITKGESVLLKTPGGGGYGNPLNRKIEEVVKDLEEDYISFETAEETYGVIFDSDGNIDLDGTKENRTKRKSFQ